MNSVDLLIAWEWEYDNDFIHRLNDTCIKNNISSYLVSPSNREETFDKLHSGELQFKVLYDRASDADTQFLPLISIAQKCDAKVINAFGNTLRAMDKATMHLEFLTKGIHVPYTVILSPYDKDPHLNLTELEHLGRPFIIKPANGGGGTGVVIGAESLHDIIEARKQFGNDKYLLQEHINPIIMGVHRAWFRVYYCCGTSILCWWDDCTHIYEMVTTTEEDKYKLSGMHDIVDSIAEVCKLDFFSTEICKSTKDMFVCVDYVNDPCDMRIKSIYPEGVPDVIVTTVIQSITQHVKKCIKE